MDYSSTATTIASLSRTGQPTRLHSDKTWIRATTLVKGLEFDSRIVQAKLDKAGPKGSEHVQLAFAGSQVLDLAQMRTHLIAEIDAGRDPFNA